MLGVYPALRLFCTIINGGTFNNQCYCAKRVECSTCRQLPATTPKYIMHKKLVISPCLACLYTYVARAPASGFSQRNKTRLEMLVGMTHDTSRDITLITTGHQNIRSVSKCWAPACNHMWPINPEMAFVTYTKQRWIMTSNVLGNGRELNIYALL